MSPINTKLEMMFSSSDLDSSIYHMFFELVSLVPLGTIYLLIRFTVKIKAFSNPFYLILLQGD